MTNETGYVLSKNQHSTPQRTQNLLDSLNPLISDPRDHILLLPGYSASKNSKENEISPQLFLSSSESSTSKNQINVTPLTVKINAAARSLKDLHKILSDKMIKRDDSLIMEQYIENMQNTFELIDQGQKQLLRGLANSKIENIDSLRLELETEGWKEGFEIGKVCK
jgi:hypothetical protein